MPEQHMKLGNAPVNEFMPKPENIVVKKVARENEAKRGQPKKLETGIDNFELWFKQDDTFDQAFVKLDMKILTTDCTFPIDPKAYILAKLWNNMIQENLRELLYMADLSGIQSQFHVLNESIKFEYFSYNTNIEKFLSKAFKSIHDFEVDEVFFYNILTKKIRNIKNASRDEPYRLLDA